VSGQRKRAARRRPWGGGGAVEKRRVAPYTQLFKREKNEAIKKNKGN